MLKRIFLLGGSGQVGLELQRTFADLEVVAPSHTDLPIEDTEKVSQAVDALKPDCVINCTAFHQVDACEADPERAFLLNGTLVGRLSCQSALRGIQFVTISSDYVFSGDDQRAYDELDRPAPKNVYGASKVAGEHLAILENERAIVFRISGVFGRLGRSNKGPTFVERMISMAANGERPTVVDNIVFSPSYAPDIAKAMRLVIEASLAGIVHVTNQGQCSWHELAQEAIRAAGYEVPVERTTFVNEPGKLKRPLHSPLSNRVLAEQMNVSVPPWQEGVAKYIRERQDRAVIGQA